MEILAKALLAAHITAGFTSIVLFWVPMFTKKGGNLHIKSGKFYVKAMWVVTATAGLLSVKNIVIGAYGPAIFLGFLALITSGPLWYAISILDQKKGRTPEFMRNLFLYHSVVVLWAIGMIIYALNITDGMRIVLFIFGGLGLTSITHVWRYIRNKESKLTWIQEHLVGMITTGIAAYTAFFVFGGSNFFGHLFEGQMAVILWVGPGILGTIANFYYSKKFAPSTS